jgi:hypothetical protein
MRASLGAMAVEVRSHFGGDLFQVRELSSGSFRVGLATTADVPLPLPPFSLVQAEGGDIIVDAPDSMSFERDGETVTVRWQDVAIVIAPTLPAMSRRLKPKRAWPLELLSSTTVSVIGLTALFPAVAALMLSGHDLETHEPPTVHARIVFTHRLPLQGGEPASPPSRAASKAADSGERDAHSGERDAHSGERDAKMRPDDAVAQAAAKEAAARAGVLGLIDSEVRILGSQEAVPGGGAAGGSAGGAAGGGSAGGAAGDATGDPSETGEAYGVGGLGLSGVGAGGGGTGDTIGLGNIGTIGHGGGTGTGSGYGSGAGGLGGRRAHAPDVVLGSAQVRGGLDKEMIRRVIRRHLNEVRYCYEKALQAEPSLAGRVMVEFVIDEDGSVRAAAARESTLANPAVGACTAGAFLRWQFPTVRGGGLVLVHYPFDFVPEAAP